MRTHRLAIAAVALAAAFATTAPALAAPPANDDWANATSLGSALSIGTSVDLDEATGEVFEQHPAGATDTSVWFSWTAPTDGRVQATACAPDGTVYDHVDVYAGASLSALVEQTGAGPGLCGVGKAFQAWAGFKYYIQVEGTIGYPHLGSAPFELDLRTTPSATITMPAAVTSDASGNGSIKASGLKFFGFDWGATAVAPGDCTLDGSKLNHIKYCDTGAMGYQGLAIGQHTLKFHSLDPWGFWSNEVTSTITVPAPTPKAPVTTPQLPAPPATPATPTTPVGATGPVPTAPACAAKPVVKASARLSLRTLRTRGARVTFAATSACPLTFTLSVTGHRGALATKRAVKSGTALRTRPSRAALRRLHLHRGARLKLTATNAASVHTSITVRVTA